MKKTHIAIGLLFVIGSISLLLYFYFSSPNVLTSGPERWGGPAEFGQFGDMIGGILNPIFGFLTVILLLKTLSTEHRVLKTTEIKDHSIVIDTLIKNRMEKLNQIMENGVLYTNPLTMESDRQKFHLNQISVQDSYGEYKQLVTLIVENIYQNKASTAAEIFKLCCDQYDMQNYRTIAVARKSIFDIQNLYLESVKINELPYLKEYLKEKLEEFMADNLFIGLITPEEYTAASNSSTH